MNLFDDIGSPLGSLSLHDSQMSADTADAEDAMEIDPEIDMTDDTHNPKHRCKHSSLYNENDDDEEVSNDEGGVYNLSQTFTRRYNSDEEKEPQEEHDSFLRILSPTALGVRFALKPQKLLMPPPKDHISSRLPQLSVDYEFDTSDMDSTQLSKKNFLGQTNSTLFQDASVNVFQASGHSLTSVDESVGPEGYVEPQPMRINPFSSSFPSFMGQISHSSGIFSNANNLHRSVATQPQTQTIIHHHHYYAAKERSWSDSRLTKSPSLIKTTNGISSSSDRDLSMSPEAQLAKTEHSSDISPGFTSINKTNFNRSQLVSYSYGEISPYLPLPWDSKAVPVDKKPYVLLSYLQLLTNTLLYGFALHTLVSMVQAVRNDVSQKMKHEMKTLLVEIALCQRAYNDNHCVPSERVPALENLCDYWERCMSQDPAEIGNLSLIGAHTLGVILNSLVEPLGLKFLGIGAFLVVLIFACNFGFGYIRARAYYGMAQHYNKRE